MIYVISPNNGFYKVVITCNIGLFALVVHGQEILVKTKMSLQYGQEMFKSALKKKIQPGQTIQNESQKYYWEYFSCRKVFN